MAGQEVRGNGSEAAGGKGSGRAAAGRRRNRFVAWFVTSFMTSAGVIALLVGRFLGMI